MLSKRFFILLLLLFFSTGITGCSSESTGSGSAIKNTPNQGAAADSVVAFYFHGRVRCGPCSLIEQYTQEAIQTHFKEELKNKKLAFKSINVEQPENRHFIEDFKLYSRGVVIAKLKDGKTVEWKNLPGVWQNIRNKNAFESYIKAEIEKYMGDV